MTRVLMSCATARLAIAGKSVSLTEIQILCVLLALKIFIGMSAFVKNANNFYQQEYVRTLSVQKSALRRPTAAKYS